MNIVYNGKDNIRSDKRFIVSSYDTDVNPELTREWEELKYDGVPPDPDLIRYFSAVDEIGDKSRECNQWILDNTAGMNIPIDDPNIGKSSAYFGGSDSSIDQNTWLKAQNIKSDPNILDKVKKIDVFSMLWTEIRIFIDTWLAGKIRDSRVLNIPPINGIAKLLEDDASSLRSQSLTADFKSMDNTETPNNLASIVHADNVVNHVRKYISNPFNRPNFDPNAVELKPIIDGQNKSWGTSKSVILGTYGVDVWGLQTDVTVTKNTPGDRTDLTEWAKREGKDVVSPGIDAYKYVRKNILSDKFWDTAVSGASKAYTESSMVLKGYISSQDMACCLLDNLMKSAKAAGNIKYLKALKLALLYLFNGLNIKMDSMFNSLVDIFNQIVGMLIGKLMGAIQGALDRWLLDLRNYLNDYIKTNGDTWRRCYPFDEFMRYCITALYDMENDLMAYLNDYLGTIKLSQVKLSEYNINLKKRESLRKYINIVDAVIKGIEMGIVCKDLGEMEYTPPTSAEMIGFATTWGAIKDTLTPEDAVSIGRTPETGLPIGITKSTDEEFLDNILAPPERLWLQDCDKSMTDDDIREFRDGLRKVGIL